jgi:hypothetical protein
LTDADLDSLSGRALGTAIPEAMFELSRPIGFPTRLADLPALGQVQALTGCHSLKGLGEHKRILPSDIRPKCLAPE